MLRSDPRRIDLRHFDQFLQSEPPRVAQTRKAALQQVACVVGLHRDVRHNAQRDQIQMLDCFLSTINVRVERFGEFVGNTDTGQ